MTLTRRLGLAALLGGITTLTIGPALAAPAATCPPKTFKLDKSAMKDLAQGRGGAFATDRITVDGEKVGYMYREKPHNPQDSGWRFFAGDESDAYIDDLCHTGVYDVNTVVNYDPDILPFLDKPEGSAFVRSGKSFRPD